MRDRWSSRDEPRSLDQGDVYWHLLMSHYPEATRTGQAAQATLQGHLGLHLTPVDRLHVTLLKIGSTDAVPADRRADLCEAARIALRWSSAVTVNLRRVLYHPEAIMLAVEPREPVAAIRSAVAGLLPVDTETTGWTPHMTIAYSTSDQEAAPLVEAVGRSVESAPFAVTSVSLVVQWGPERLWDWETADTIPLGFEESGP